MSIRLDETKVQRRMKEVPAIHLMPAGQLASPLDGPVCHKEINEGQVNSRLSV